MKRPIVLILVGLTVIAGAIIGSRFAARPNPADLAPTPVVFHS